MHAVFCPSTATATANMPEVGEHGRGAAARIQPTILRQLSTLIQITALPGHEGANTKYCTMDIRMYLSRYLSDGQRLIEAREMEFHSMMPPIRLTSFVRELILNLISSHLLSLPL